MSTSFQLHPVMRRSLQLAVFAGAGLAVAGAQTASTATDSTSPVQPLSFGTAAVPSFATSATAPQFSSSVSSSADSYDPTQAANQQLASLEKTFALPGAEGMQYGQRRRYGSPRYRGGNTNADGSEKYTGYAGVGFQTPLGNNSNYLTTSWGFQVGAGRNFNKHVGVNLEFDYDKFGMTGTTISNQSVRYFNDPTNSNGLDANSHIWSFSFQPTYQIYSGQGLGAYVTAGVGFYHKVANFTLPEQAQYCDYIYGCYSVYVNSNVDHYTSNAPGFDGGIGLTYKFSRFSNERLFAEVRYVYIDNQFRPGATNTTAVDGTYTGNNYFPENSNTTSYIPVKVGIRF